MRARLRERVEGGPPAVPQRVGSASRHDVALPQQSRSRATPQDIHDGSGRPPLPRARHFSGRQNLIGDRGSFELGLDPVRIISRRMPPTCTGSCQRVSPCRQRRWPDEQVAGTKQESSVAGSLDERSTGSNSRRSRRDGHRREARTQSCRAPANRLRSRIGPGQTPSAIVGQAARAGSLFQQRQRTRPQLPLDRAPRTLRHRAPRSPNTWDPGAPDHGNTAPARPSAASVCAARQRMAGCRLESSEGRRKAAVESDAGCGRAAARSARRATGRGPEHAMAIA